MMPADLAGLLVFIILLTPGFCHLLAAERQVAPGRPKESALRELASIGLVSVVTNTIVLLLYLAAAKVAESLPKLEPIITADEVWWRANLLSELLLGVILVSLSSLLAYAWAASDATETLIGWLSLKPRLRWLLPRGGAEINSSWWHMLQTEAPQNYRYITCVMDNAWTIAGWLKSHNNRAEEVGDRDLVLSAPIETIDADGHSHWQRTGAVILSARNIKVLRIEYPENGPNE